jgi:hypothetical protein
MLTSIEMIDIKTDSTSADLHLNESIALCEASDIDGNQVD